ncbi:MAG: hypothetical protein HRU01_02570 [Myxococcales bacterium]|nr:hypothetical protein [Myxococcales bacterium]
MGSSSMGQFSNPVSPSQAIIHNLTTVASFWWADVGEKGASAGREQRALAGPLPASPLAA